MPNFVSTSQLLRKKYEENKHKKVLAAPEPVSEVCKSCWFRPVCVVRTLLKSPPRTCCVYELFGAQGKQEVTIEDMVKFTCDTKCVERQAWADSDPCPHDAHYCTNHCPVSRHILEKGPSNYKEVPAENYG